ncbi:MAG: type IV toxin-antitoxin system AbiEi family antitoxin [Chloracidobacterium sp.]|nr:type IV toxin-antitoxin system AbiEi family antitoxin [Chloracidobacterium sp.]
MSAINTSKIHRLLTSQPSGIVFQAKWLTDQGYSGHLQKKYRQSNWLVSIGTGAMIRAGDQVGYEGAIYALQAQTGLTVHPGGRTALSLAGKAHYLEMDSKKVTLFGNQGEKLPTWFREHNWGVKIDFHPSSFLPPDVGMTDIDFRTFSIKVSGAARALMECLYLAPDKQDLMECYELMEGLNNLRPDQVQILLEKCRSIKVKRLFLYLAEKCGHGWVEYLDLKNVDLGRGKRSIVKNGIFMKKYQITVPKEFEESGKSNL